MSVKSLVKDSDFDKLSPDAQQKALAAIDPEFANISSDGMKQVVTAIRQPSPKIQQPSFFHTAALKTLDALPAIGGIGGGILGLPLAPATLGASSVGLAALGGAAGEAYRQIGRRYLGEAAPTTSANAAENIGLQGAKQGVGELIGQGITAVGKPVVEATEPLWAPVGRGLAKSGKLLTGVPAQKFIRLAKDPMAFFAPSTEKAGEDLGDAMAAQGLRKRLSVEARYDPDASAATKSLIVTIKKLEDGGDVGIQQLADSKKLINKLLSAEKDKGIKREIFQDKQLLDDAIGKKAPELLGAQKDYARSVLAEDFRSPLPITKTGEYALFRSGMGPALIYHNPVLGTALTALTSPFVSGGITTAGALGMRALANPAVRRTALSFGAKLLKDSQYK